jgi:predicted secreted protein
MHIAARPRSQATPFTSTSLPALPQCGSSIPPHLLVADINDGAGLIKLDLPCFVDATGALPVSVQVSWPMVLAKAVARLHLIADGNENPLLARVSLIPDLVPPHVSLTTHLEQSSLVRALVECGDGELLEVSRWVWVMPAEG